MLTNSIGNTGQTTGQKPPTSNDALRNLDIDHFLTLMITELQNQDPLNPMENNDILQQIGQMREIAASSQLADTLDAVLLGQSLNSATTMIGKHINALSDSGEAINGVVDKVSMTNGEPRLHVGSLSTRLTNVKEVVPAAS